MFRTYPRFFLLAPALLVLGVSLSGCVTKPYKADVVQGNFVSSEQVAALKAGMSKVQVRNILGTPLLTDLFHADRWDYVFTIERDGVPSQPRHLTTYFKGETLERWAGDEMPSEFEFVKSLDSGRKIGKVPSLTASEKDLNDFAQRENSKQKTTDGPAAVPASAKDYPLLETP
jgi:outer membrane protein assembly factor BamE